MKVRLYELFPRCLYPHFFHNTKYLGLIHFFIVRQPLFLHQGPLVSFYIYSSKINHPLRPIR